MDPQRLMQTYPWLDHMMAETLLKIHERGKLDDYLKDWPEPDRGPPASISRLTLTFSARLA